MMDHLTQRNRSQEIKFAIFHSARGKHPEEPAEEKDEIREKLLNEVLRRRVEKFMNWKQRERLEVVERKNL